MPKLPDSSGSTPRSATSLFREADESITTLRARVVGKTASLYGFDIDTPDPIIRQMGKLLKDSVTTFLTKWYGLGVVPLGQGASIIIANEAPPAAISQLARQVTASRKAPPILVLCSQSSRFQRTVSQTTSSGNVGFLVKPVGPLKLARSILQCLEGSPPLITPGILEPQSAPGGSNLSGVFEELSISLNAAEVLDNSRMAADSDNARKAIESPPPNMPVEKHQEFPFPSERISVLVTKSMPSDKEALAPLAGDNAPTSEVLMDMETSAVPVAPTEKSLPGPCLLLVDDNKINLTLLRTYMRKRNYQIVDEAENGLEAVNRFNSRVQGYDIIFMDISMPVLDGFGATRQIRAIEAFRRKKAAENRASLAGVGAGEEGRGKENVRGEGVNEKQTSALIIALTGLASSRDQNEALASGIDLFLTKPVSFKEVGKMLDNWEANRAKDGRDAAA
jgi:CheY-like chemotaxis protein